MRRALFFLVLAFLAYGPFLAFPCWRGTEARRVEIAREMVASGDWVVPRLWEEPIYTKPPLYYWVLAASLRVFGVSRLAARLPSVLAFALLAWLACGLLAQWYGERAGVLGGIGVLVSPVLAYDVPFAEIDPLFAALTVLSLLCLADGVLGGRRARLVQAGVLGGLAVLTKGPPYLMFCLGPLWIWWRHARLRGLLSYLPFVVGFLLAYEWLLGQRGNLDEASSTAVDELMVRLRSSGRVLLAYLHEHVLRCLLVLPVPFTPWFFAWLWDLRRPRSQRERSEFLLWAAISGMVVLVFSNARSGRYLLPAAALLILGLAPLVARTWRSLLPPPEWVRRLLLVLGCLAGLAAVVTPWLPPPYPGTTVFGLLAIAGIGWFAHRQRHLVWFALAVPLVVIWTAFPDRIEYHRTAHDFAPDAARVLARELRERGVSRLELVGHVPAAALLHLREDLPSLEIHGSERPGHRPTDRWILIEDLGTVRDPERSHVEVVEAPGYRIVVRVGSSRHQSLSLRERS